jgi:hypothetical protein
VRWISSASENQNQMLGFFLVYTVRKDDGLVSGVFFSLC